MNDKAKHLADLLGKARARLAKIAADREAMMQRITPPKRRRPRKPPEAGLPVPAIPPRGPAPLQGGTAAALDAAGE